MSLFNLQSPVEEEELPINLTPLIDVVFIVLIAFIVVAPFLQTDKIDLAEAGIQSTAIQNISVLHLQVDEADTIRYQSKKFTLEELNIFLQAQKKVQTVQLSFSTKSHFGLYQQIKNILKKNGVEEMQIILKP